MEIILLQDVKGLGKRGECVNTSDGYANNFLIPRKLAVRKTEETLRTLEKENDKEAKRQEELKNEAIKNKQIIESVTLNFKAKAQTNGDMIGTISTKEIVNKLKDEYKVVVDKRKFIDKISVNAFGITNLKILLYKDVVATIRVKVSEE